MLYLFDIELVLDILNNIDWSINQIKNRLENVQSFEDLTQSNSGIQNLDSICMQLVNIGEALKQVDKISFNSIFSNYPEIDWKKAKGLRDIISHHYFDVDAEIIYNVCKTQMQDMEITINKIIKELANKH